MTKQQLWEQRIADWKKSGLSQRAFCQQQGLAISTFCAWLRKSRKAKNDNHTSPTAFLPVVVEKPSAAPSGTVDVHTSDLTFEVSIPQLAQLITELNRHA